jgi:gluconolactonase
LDPSFESLISPEAKLRKISTGFIFTEGPVWHPLEQCLYFSDIPGSVRSKWDGANTTTVMKPSNKGNGMTLDPNLDLLVCEHTTSSVVRFGKDGQRHVLATHYDGQELNSPNDLCMRSDGAIYFSDPTYGRTAVYGKERPVELGYQGIYRLLAGKLDLLVPKEIFTQPNGLCFSPDERLLYVNDSVQANIRVFDVRSDGLIENGRIFATGIVGKPDGAVADGMKCDASGNIWCTAPDGVWVYNPHGRVIGKVVVPEVAGNLHWGGADWKTLFICGSTSVYAIDVKVGPHIEPFMRAAEARKSATALKQ